MSLGISTGVRKRKCRKLRKTDKNASSFNTRKRIEERKGRSSIYKEEKEKPALKRKNPDGQEGDEVQNCLRSQTTKKDKHCILFLILL